VTVVFYVVFSLIGIAILSGLTRGVLYWIVSGRVDKPNVYRKLAIIDLAWGIADLTILVVAGRLFWTHAVENLILVIIFSACIAITHVSAKYLCAKVLGLSLLDAFKLSGGVPKETSKT
jgi:hypothetical protein